MQISVDNPFFQTLIFGVIFIFGLVLSVRKSEAGSFFSKSRTEELKGFAIFAIIFSHIGYFLASDHSFLYPFSVIAGVGVDLFLFLSGFGLTVSALSRPLYPLSFYKKRLSGLFLPMWIVVMSFIALDFIFLHKSYVGLTIIESLLGFFPVADISKSLDSPLWYFSLILFYYLLFPLFFWKKIRYISPLLLWLAGFLILKLSLPVNLDVINLYKLHIIAFPLGVLFANIYSTNFLKKVVFPKYLKYFLLTFALLGFAYFSINSGVGKDKNTAQTISILTMFLAVFIFLAKGFEFKLFNLFGKYSYVIYLVHWPILLRYGVIYQLVPAYLATILYLLIFLILSWCITKITQWVL